MHAHLTNAARVKYPAALQRCKIDTPLLAAGSLIEARSERAAQSVGRNAGDNGDKKSAIKIGDKKTTKTRERLQQILQCMEAGVEYSADIFAESIGLKASRTRELLKMLVAEDQVEVLGENRNRRYKLK